MNWMNVVLGHPALFALATQVPAESPSSGGSGFDFIAPILSTGMVGVFLLMVILRIKIMPTYVYEDAKKEWERERAEKSEGLEEARRALLDGQKVYTEQVIPTLTRALDAERELLDLRRTEQARAQFLAKGQS